MDFPVDYFTGDGTSTTFQLSFTPASATSILVHIGGVKQVASTTDPAYYLDGSKLVFVSPPGAYSPIEVNYLGIAGQVNIPGTQSVTQDMLSLQLANTFVYQTTANGATASFTLNAPPVSANSLVVSANGVVQYDYSVNGTNLTFGFTPPVGTFIRITSLALAQAGVPSDGSVTSVKLGANLTLTGNTSFDGFSGAGARIRGDFSNATIANRATFQTSTTNGQTVIGVIPNGSSTTTQLHLFSSPDFTNYSRLAIQNTGSEMRLYGDAAGSGTNLPMTFYTAATERMRIDTSGNVGIGTNSPAHRLDVNGQLQAKAQIYLTDSSGNDILRITEIGSRDVRIDAFNGTDFNGLIRTGAQTLLFETGTGGGITERMRITSGGSVGIYNTGPSSNNLLTVGNLNGVTRSNIVAIQGSSTVDNYGNCIEFGHSNSAGYRSTLGAWVGNGAPFLGLQCEAGTTGNTFRTRGIAGSLISTDNAGAMTFNRVTNSNADNQTAVESMRIDSSGSVYIAGTSLAVLGYEKLNVLGSAGVKSTQTNALGVWNTTSPGLIQFYTEAGGTNAGGISAVGGAMSITSGTNLTLNAPGSNIMAFQTNSSERMRLDSSGRLAIGLNDPQTFSSGVAQTVIERTSAGSNTVALALVNRSGATNTSVSLDFNPNTNIALAQIRAFRTDASFGGGTDFRFLNYDGSALAERMRIDSSGRVTTPAQPAFYGGRTAGDVSPNTVFVMNDAQINIGSCYNTSTGSFTCPVAGVYFASFGVMTQSAYSGDIDFFYIQKNGVNIVSNYTTGRNATYQRIAATVLINCAANDTIRFRTGGTTIYGQSSTHSYGSIYLIG
jgi:hypothetical protein